MLKFYICDPFYPSFSADLIIGTLGAFLGIVGAYLLYLTSQRQTKKDRLKYLVSVIESLIPSVIRQSKYCEEHAEAIMQKPFDNVFLKLEANRDVKRLADKVDQEGVFHAYLWKYKRTNNTYQEFKNIYGYIDYLDSLLDDLIRTNEKVLMANWDRKKQYAVSFKRVKENIQSLSINQELAHSQPEFTAYCSSLLERFSAQSQNGENLIDSFDIVVNPLRIFIIEKAKLHPKITELLFLLDDLFNQYAGIELSVKHNAADYQLYGRQLKKQANELDEVSKRLKEDFSTK